MTVFALRLPEDLKNMAAAQAASAGISLNQFIATAVAVRVGAMAEAERYFAARAARTMPGRGKAILARAGIGNPPRPEDRLDLPE
ncbi:MAG: toxin-antitoxin system HicB family antitoxin [Aliidongia sp.]